MRLLGFALRLGAVALLCLTCDHLAAEQLTLDHAVNLPLGELASGSITEDDRLINDGSKADAWRIEVQAGVRYRVTLSSAAFDTYLLIYDATGGLILASNDDGPGIATNSQAEILAEYTGAAYVIANALLSDKTGDYTVRVNIVEQAQANPLANPEPEQEVGTLELGQTIDGELRDGDLSLDDESLADAYLVSLEAGRTYTITLRSSVFDAYLKLLDGELNDVAVNDDAPGLETNARIVIRPEVTGQYLVLANALAADGRGAYRLSLDDDEPAPAAQDRDNASVQSSLRSAMIPGVGRLHAVVVGLDYLHQASGHLPQCDDDARYIADTLRAVVPASQLNLNVLINEQATVQNLNQQIAAITRDIQPNDMVLLFYSGHGGQDDRPESATLLEADRKPEFLALYDGVYFDAMLNQALEPLNETNHTMTLVALDCCYSGGFNDVINRPGRMGLFSSQEYLVSGVPRDPDEYQRLFGGHMSKLLCLALQGRADGVAIDAAVPEDGNVTVLELEKYIRSEWKPVVIEGQYQEPVFVRPAVNPMQVLVSTASAGQALAVVNRAVDLLFRDRAIATGQTYYSEDFPAKAGRRYILETSDLVGGLDTVLSIRGSTNPERAMDDDPVYGENDDLAQGNAASRLEWQCPADGTYYIAVRGFDQTAGQFTLRIQEVVEQARAEALNVYLTDFHIAGQTPVHTADYDLIAGRSYRIQTLDLSAGCDTVVQLRRSTNPDYADENDPVVAENDDAPGATLASDLSWVCTETGRYYVTIRSFGESSGTFSLAMNEVAEQANPAIAVPLALSFPSGVDLLLNEPVELADATPRHFGDYQLVAGQTLVGETHSLTDGCDTVLELRRSTNPDAAQDDDPVVARSDDAHGSLASRFEWTVDQSGPYYLTVRAYDNRVGSCNLTLRSAMPARDTIETDPIELVADRNHNQGDYRILQGRRVVIETYDLTEGLDTVIELRRSTDPQAVHPEDPLLAINDDADGLSSRIHWVCPEDGDYYIKVYTVGEQAGRCRLRVRFER